MLFEYKSESPTAILLHVCRKNLGQIIHTRSKYSSLNQHLFHRNIIQSSYVSAGLSNTLSISFLTVLYTKQELIISISLLCRSIFNILLYGDQNWLYDINKQIFIIVQYFIIKSKRSKSTENYLSFSRNDTLLFIKIICSSLASLRFDLCLDSPPL